MANTNKRKPAPSHKRGDDKNEMAVKHRKAAKNFKQSKDIHEDRGTIQKKMGRVGGKGKR